MVHVEQVVAQLTRLADASEKARAVGLQVSLPPELREACAAVIQLAEQDPLDEVVPATSPAQVSVTDPMYALMPLRRLLWHVVEVGEQVTVPTVGERLARLGRTESASAVSNALGYWVRRGRLERVCRGVYRRP